MNENKNKRKKQRIKFNNLFLAFGCFVLIAFIAIGLIKISEKGGINRAKKEAEVNSQFTTSVTVTTTQKKVEETTIKQSEQTTKIKTPSTTNSTNKDYVSPTSESMKNFFGNSAFIGDSVMLGMSNYATKKGGDFLGGPLFLVAGSFSAAHALQKVSSESPHPLYKGERRLIEDSIKQSGVDKVFLFFGLNDIGLYGVEKTVENYQTIIKRIKDKSPSVNIIIISTTYMLTPKEGKLLNNSNIAKLNNQMREFCSQNNYGFIDIANHIGDETNGLKEKYCSDGYLHENELAYDVWVKQLCQYAQRSL